MAKSHYEMYIEPKLELIRGWARDGLNHKQIYTNLGIKKTTYFKWLAIKADFMNAVKNGREVTDYIVENSTFERVSGKMVTWEERAIKVADKEFDPDTGRMVRMTERIEIVKVHKLVVPDTAGQAFWLKNRKPDKWFAEAMLNQANNNADEDLNPDDGFDKAIQEAIGDMEAIDLDGMIDPASMDQEDV